MAENFRQRLQAFQNEQDRLRAEREFRDRRSQGVAERARQRQAEADAQRRQAVDEQRAARREQMARSRAQADVERFNRPPRIVPYQEQVPATTPRQSLTNPLRPPVPMAGGGGGGAGMPPGGGGNLPMASGDNLPAQRGGAVQRTPSQIELTTPRMPRMGMGAGAAGAVLGPGLMAADMASDYVRRRQADIDALYEAEALRRAAANSERAIEPEGSPEAAIMNRPQPRMGDPEGSMEAASARPARPAPRPRPRAAAPRGMSEADRLNEISLAFARGERPRGGAADTIGKAMGIEGYKKGGLIEPKKVVKKAAGGMLKTPKAPAAPGRGPGRPATSVKPVGTRAMAKAAAPKKPVGMPAFKKGGKVSMKKGKK